MNNVTPLTPTEDNTLSQLIEATGPLPGLLLTFDQPRRLLTVTMSPERFSITHELATSLRTLQLSIKKRCLPPNLHKPFEPPIKWVVYQSISATIFLLGADLSILLNAVRDDKREALIAYARLCADISDTNTGLLGGHVPTIAVVRGKTVGGGFEAVASCNLVIADKTAKFQLPEMKFHTFPGLAYSFVGRRTSLKAVDELVLTGKTWDAAEAAAKGVIDILTDDPASEVNTFVDSIVSHAAYCATLRVKKRIAGPNRAELTAVTRDWTQTVANIPAAAIHTIERLQAVQDQMVRRSAR